MRLATARDEILPLRDPRVQDNEAYLTVLLLARVVDAARQLSRSTPRVVEGLFAVDLAFLQDLYRRLNQEGHTQAARRPARRARTSSRWTSRGAAGGVLTYAADRLVEEVAYVAYHFHWPLADILDLEHPLRQQFVQHIGRLSGAGGGEEQWGGSATPCCGAGPPPRTRCRGSSPCHPSVQLPPWCVGRTGADSRR